jgi:DNA (cytosine-5)-methyltransferase 1
MSSSNKDSLIDVRDLASDERKFRVVSLFCGCGGLDVGLRGDFSVFHGKNKKYFAPNPFDVVWANDVDKDAVKTYNLNLGKHAVCKDINDIDLSEIPDCEIVTGGFPCQDFSIAGKQQGFKNERRGTLYRQMIKVITHKKPIAFLAENVKNIINPKLIDVEKNQPVIQTILEDFNNAGYNVYYRLLFAPDYGIPQRRERVFIIGIRKDIQSTFNYPSSHHPKMTSKQAIDDLWGKELSGKIPNHDQVSLAKFRPKSKVGTQGNEMIPENGPSHAMRAEHHMNIQAHYRTLHPQNDKEDRKYWRRLTVREAARLQTFPDKFKFIGMKGSTYKQIGNAVPPILGWYISRALAKALESITNYPYETHVETHKESHQ